MIAVVAVPVAAWSSFDYWVPDGVRLAPGSVVRVRFARRGLLGVIVETSGRSDVDHDKLQPIDAVVTEIPPLAADLLECARFVSDYYQQPLGMVLGQMLPPLVTGSARPTSPVAWRITDTGGAALPSRLGRATRTVHDTVASWLARADRTMAAVELEAGGDTMRRALRRWQREGLVEPLPGWAPEGALARVGPALNPGQRHASDAIAAAQGFSPFLLEGITGSGKTEVYVAAALHAITAGRQVLLLVPEINLTPQLEERVRQALPGTRVVTLHSRLAAGERLRAHVAAAAGEADLVLGTRLAVFVPLPKLGLIVVDEEHDASFKQQDKVRYHARDVAVWRARQRDVPVVLGSATPSLESLQHASSGRYVRLALTERAVAPARLPQVAFEPARSAQSHDGLGPTLVAAIETRLARGEQSLVFINRRGFAPSLLCGACGWRAECPNCSARLVLHRHDGALRCHHCAHAARVPQGCPSCGNVDLLPLGHGTERVEGALRRRFPAARIARVDRDTTARKGAFAEVRDNVAAGALDILVGTQMLAKGHDFPRLTLVGVIGADDALYSADFRATERLVALLFQVAGRAGRADLPGEVVIATDFPRHAVYEAVAAQDYARAAEALLAERRAAGMPPFSHLAMIAAEAAGRAQVDAFLAAASALGRASARELGLPVQVHPPVAATLSRRAGMERGQVLAESTHRGALQRLLPIWRAGIEAIRAPGIRWAIDVDPLAVS